jgi:hypothetical protein
MRMVQLNQKSALERLAARRADPAVRDGMIRSHLALLR